MRHKYSIRQTKDHLLIKVIKATKGRGLLTSSAVHTAHPEAALCYPRSRKARCVLLDLLGYRLH
jgi:hypothetical protein